MTEAPDLSRAFESLASFLDGKSLTEVTASLESNLDGKVGANVDDVIHAAGVNKDLLLAAVQVRSEMGRINDVIHAAAITLSLPSILRPDEKIANRPSLAAGNDPSRPFDVETDYRIAEFKLAQWTGADAMRKRQVFKDLFKLAIDDSGRRAELYFVGERPLRFLRGSKSTARWALDRHTAVAKEFTQHFGSLDIPVCEFTINQAAHVRLIDLTVEIPELFANLV